MFFFIGMLVFKLFGAKMGKQRMNVLDMLWRFSKVLRLKKTELRIYDLLSKEKKPLLVREISRKLHASRRIVQGYVKTLTERGLLKRKLVYQGYLAYKYVSRSPRRVWGKVKSEINRILNEGDKVIK
jgi:predicted DNA-binding transcriptional regulator